MSDDSEKQTNVKGDSNTSLVKKVAKEEQFARTPKCKLCQNHGINIPIKGHKRWCPKLMCDCSKCMLIFQKREISKQEIKQHRADKEEKEKKENRAAKRKAEGELEHPWPLQLKKEDDFWFRRFMRLKEKHETYQHVLNETLSFLLTLTKTHYSPMAWSLTHTISEIICIFHQYAESSQENVKFRDDINKASIIRHLKIVRAIARYMILLFILIYFIYYLQVLFIYYLFPP